MITLDMVEHEVRRLANENPKQRYSDIDPTRLDVRLSPCRYVIDSKGGCIMGQALVNLGIGVEEFNKLEGHRAPTVLQRFGIVKDRDEALWFGIVQENQDYNLSWGDSVNLADDECGL